jgi:hypothetical protein
MRQRATGRRVPPGDLDAGGQDVPKGDKPLRLPLKLSDQTSSEGTGAAVAIRYTGRVVGRGQRSS